MSASSEFVRLISFSDRVVEGMSKFCKRKRAQRVHFIFFAWEAAILWLTCNVHERNLNEQFDT